MGVPGRPRERVYVSDYHAGAVIDAHSLRREAIRCQRCPPGGRLRALSIRRGMNCVPGTWLAHRASSSILKLAALYKIPDAPGGAWIL